MRNILYIILNPGFMHLKLGWRRQAKADRVGWGPPKKGQCSYLSVSCVCLCAGWGKDGFTDRNKKKNSSFITCICKCQLCLLHQETQSSPDTPFSALLMFPCLFFAGVAASLPWVLCSEPKSTCQICLKICLKLHQNLQRVARETEPRSIHTDCAIFMETVSKYL